MVASMKYLEDHLESPLGRNIAEDACFRWCTRYANEVSYRVENYIVCYIVLVGRRQDTTLFRANLSKCMLTTTVRTTITSQIRTLSRSREMAKKAENGYHLEAGSFLDLTFAC